MDQRFSRTFKEQTLAIRANLELGVLAVPLQVSRESIHTPNAKSQHIVLYTVTSVSREIVPALAKVHLNSDVI